MVPQQHSFVRSLLEWVVIFALVFVFFIFIRWFVVEPYRVPTGSMEPTIEVGDQVLAQKVTITKATSSSSVTPTAARTTISS